MTGTRPLATPEDARALARLPQRMRADWQSLAALTSDPQPFELGMLAGLPAPARRWLTHAIKPGTPLLRASVFTQHGQIKMGRWLDFEADWILAPPDRFVWAARTHLGPVPIRGFDRYTHAAGEMSWRLFGRIPLVGVTGPDVSRSALGRVAAELCFVPAAALACSVTWEEVDDRRVIALVVADGRTHRVTLTVAASGALEQVEVPRWGNPDGHPFAEHLFSAVVDGEMSVDGFTIPARARGGWWQCRDGCAREEFIRLTIDTAAYR